MPELQYMWYGTKPSISFTPTTITQTETFESDTPNSFFAITNPSTMAGTEAGWVRTTEKSYAGSYSFTNTDITDAQEARVDISFTIPSSAKNIRIDYQYFQDCEQNFDGLVVYVDGNLVHDHVTDGVYGSWTASEITTSVTGTRKLTFEFQKDSDTSASTDAVYIDDLKVSYDVDSITETPGTELIRFDGSTGYELLYHRVGAQAPPVSFVEHRIPFQPGSILHHVDIQPRDVEIGIKVEGSSKSDLLNKVRNLTNKIINVDGALYARYTDGTEMRLYCRYKEGLEGEEKPETMGSGKFQKMILVFRSFDPFWYDGVGKASTVDTTFHVYINSGAYEAYPVIYVDGPATNPSIVIFKSTDNEPAVGSGKRLLINYSVPSGRKLIIDMKKKTVKLDDGTNIYGYIDSTDNKFNVIPNDGNTYYLDLDHSDSNKTIRFHSYVTIPVWGV